MIFGVLLRETIVQRRAFHARYFGDENQVVSAFQRACPTVK